MPLRTRPLTCAAALVATGLAAALIAGCQNSGNEPSSPGGPPGAGAPGGPGGMGGPGGGRMGGAGGGPMGGAPLSASASGSEIYQARCQKCHGPNGQGTGAPALTKLAGMSDAEIHQLVHDGRKRMPAFGSQLSDAQITSVVTYVKTFSGAKPAAP